MTGPPSTLPLAAASQRLRGKPGRPRKSSSDPAQDTSRTDARSGSVHQIGVPTVVAIAPRLLDLEATAAYLGVSPWTVRDLEAVGVLRARMHSPPSRP